MQGGVHAEMKPRPEITLTGVPAAVRRGSERGEFERKAVWVSRNEDPEIRGERPRLQRTYFMRKVCRLIWIELYVV